MKIGTNFWDLTFRGGVTWDDVFLPGVDFTTTSNPWNPVFVEELRHYEVLRFMDFGKVNNSTERFWSDRTRKTDQRPTQERVAYEWMIDLSNRTGVDFWVCIPAMADDAYVVELANLIKTHLDPALKVYVEWSNETWNGIFSQKQYAIDKGVALGLDSNSITAGNKYHVYRALGIFSLFDSVFGADNPRIVRVISGHVANISRTEIHLDALNDATINPAGMNVDAYAIAPYFGHGVDGAAGDAIDRLDRNIDTAITLVQQQHDLITPTGMKLITYEGGQHVTSNSHIVNAKPEMYTLYTRYLDGIAPYLSLFTHYTHSGQWGGIGSWGAESYVGQPLDEAHKLRAILDWKAAQP